MTKKAVFLPNPDTDEEILDFDTDTRPQNQRTRSETLLDELVEDLNDTSDNVSLRIYLQTGSGQESYSFVESIPHDKYANQDELLMYLRDSYGPGAYRLQVRVSGKLRANKLVQIVAKKTIQQNPRSNDSELLSALLARQEKTDQLMMQILQQSKAPPASNKKEFLEEMLMYKQLFGGNSGGGGLGQIQEALSFVKELGINVGGPVAERDEGFGDILEKALPLLTAAVSPQNNPQPPRENPNMRENMLKMQIKMGVDTAVRSASKGGDPQDFAEMVADQLGERSAALAQDPTFLSQLAQYNPAVNTYKEWFLDVAEHIKAMHDLPSKFSDLYDGKEPIDIGADNGGTDNVPTGGNT